MAYLKKKAAWVPRAGQAGEIGNFRKVARGPALFGVWLEGLNRKRCESVC